MADLKSFTSASGILPVKMLKHAGFIRMLQRGFIMPIHLQWMPTNRCDQNCSYCSCGGRDKSLELDFERSKAAIETFAHLGAESVTITGGGEPMLYPFIYDLFDCFRKNGIEIGLVTNAVSSNRWQFEKMTDFRWIRLSLSDEYDMEGFNLRILLMKARLASVDLAVSYVVTVKPDFDKMRRALEIANENRLSHIRFVFDINSSESVSVDLEKVFEGLDVSRAIMQKRQEYGRGRFGCLISLMKPLVYADGNIYPCCGTQYATPEAERLKDMPSEFIMGSLDDIEEIWQSQAHYYGTDCRKCYYDNYNELLANIRSDVKHLKFL